MFASVLRAEDAPSQEQLQAMESAGEWQLLLQGTTRVLKLKDATGYDRGELYRLKSEGQLQLKLFSAAADTLTVGAADETAVGWSDYFSALSLLYAKSDARGYKPPATRDDRAPGYVDVLNPATRGVAIVTLWRAESTRLADDTQRVLKRAKYELIISQMRVVLSLRSLERVATGEWRQTNAAVFDLERTFINKASDWTTDGQSRVRQMEADANVIVENQGVRQLVGLKNNNRQELQSIQLGAAKLTTFCEQMATLSLTERLRFHALRTLSNDLSGYANKVLTTRYGRIK